VVEENSHDGLEPCGACRLEAGCRTRPGSEEVVPVRLHHTSLQSSACGGFLDRFSLGIDITTRSPKPTKFPHHHARKFFHCAKLRQPPTPAEQHKIISNPLLPRVDFPKAMLPDADASGMDCHPSFYEASTPKKTILPTCQSAGFQHQLRQRPALFQKSLTSSSIAGALVAFGMVSVQQRSSSRRWFAREVRCKNLKAENISRLALKQAKFSARLWFSI
jgi:hypothetical protein